MNSQRVARARQYTHAKRARGISVYEKHTHTHKRGLLLIANDCSLTICIFYICARLSVCIRSLRLYVYIILYLFPVDASFFFFFCFGCVCECGKYFCASCVTMRNYLKNLRDKSVCCYNKMLLFLDHYRCAFSRGAQSPCLISGASDMTL